jgi:rRNA maturation endonuclease Nob1
MKKQKIKKENWIIICPHCFKVFPKGYTEDLIKFIRMKNKDIKKLK